MKTTPSPISNAVNLGNPVNWNHPLNLQRIGWWRTLRQWSAGSRWYNLVNGLPATMTYYTGGSGQPTFSNFAPPGGEGSLLFNSANDNEVTIASIPNAPSTSVCTMAGWACPTTSPENYAPIIETRQASFRALCTSGASGNPLTTVWNNSSAEYTASTGLTWTLNTWVYCVGVVNGTSETTYMFKNGVLSSFNQSITSNSYASSGAWAIGVDQSGSARNWNGYLDDVSVWTRALSVTEIYELYELSQQGYPDVLNRYNPTLFYMPGLANTINWTHAQGGGGNAASSGTVTSLTYTPSSPVVAGNLGVVGITGYAAPTFTVSDSLSNVWKLAKQQGDYCAVYYSNLTNGGTTTITVTANTADELAFGYDEYNYNLPSGSAVVAEVTYGNQVTSTSISTSTPLTPTSTDLFYAIFEAAGGGASWTSYSVSSGTPNGRYSLAGVSGVHQATQIIDVLNYSLPISATGVLNSSQVAAVAAVAFKAATWNYIGQTTVLGTSSALSTSGSVTIVNAGDLILVGMSSYSATSFTISDTNSNNWSTPTFAGSGDVSGFAWCIANASGSTTITINSTANGYISFIASEFAFPSKYNAILANTITTNSGSSASPKSGNMSFSGPGQFLVYGTFGSSSSTSQSAGTGFNLINSFLYGSGSHIQQLDEYNIVSSLSSPIAASASYNSSTTWASIGATFALMIQGSAQLSCQSTLTANATVYVPSKQLKPAPKPRLGTKINFKHPLARGLYHYWAFNECGGNKVYDLVKNNTGVITTPVWKPQIYEECLSFANSTNNAVVTGTTNLSITSPITVGAKLYFTSNSGTQRTIDRWFHWAIMYVSGQLSIQLFNNSSGQSREYTATPSTPLAINTWYDVAITFDLTTLLVYINGIPVFESTTYTVSSGTQLNITLGAGDSSSLTNPMSGYMAYAYVYNRALAPNEMMALHENPYAFLQRSSPVLTPNTSTVTLVQGQANLSAQSTLTANATVYVPSTKQVKYAPKPRFGTQVNWNYPLSTNLTGAILFNECGSKSPSGASILFYDAIRGPINYYSGSFTWQPGLFGPCINSSSLIGTCPKAQTYKLSSSATISAWFNSTFTSGSSQRLFSFGISGNSTFALVLGQSGTSVGAFARTSAGSLISINSVRTGLNDGKWHHIAWSINPPNGTLYVDGVAQGIASTIDYTQTLGFGSTDIPILGAATNQADPYSGGIDCVTVFNTALTASQIEQLYVTPFCFMQPPQRPALTGMSATIINSQANLSTQSLLTANGSITRGGVAALSSQATLNVNGNIFPFQLVTKTTAAASSNSTILSTSVTIVNAGDLLVLGFSSYFNGTFTATDTDSNNWSAATTAVTGNNVAGFIWCIANASGTITVTLHSTVSAYLAFAVSEYSFASSGGIINLATTAGGTGTGTAVATSNLSFSGAYNFLIYGAAGLSTSYGTPVAGSNFNLLDSITYASGQHLGFVDEFQCVTSSASPLPATMTLGSSASWSIIGGVFQLSPSPVTNYAGLGGLDY